MRPFFQGLLFLFLVFNCSSSAASFLLDRPRPPPTPKKKKGFLGNLRDAVLRPLIAVPGSQASGTGVVGCPFCSDGRCDCTGCGGTKVDPLGGGCIMCDARGSLTCTVCNGVGVVDRVRRGGTDGRNEWTKKRED